MDSGTSLEWRDLEILEERVGAALSERVEGIIKTHHLWDGS